MKVTRSAKIFGSGPIGLAGSLILLLAASWLDAKIQPPPLLDSQPVRSAILIGAALITAALVLWSLRSLPAHDRGNRLCTDGAFKYVRHPLYGAFLSVFNFGLAIYLNSYIFISWAILLHPLWHWAVRYEERLMTEIFGDEYAEYQQRTGRFVPKLRSRRG